MAELNVSAGASRHQGIARSKKLSTRVDLTPMVDLGFLLITFFVFTTTATEPTAMRLLLPADTRIHNMPTPESATLTVIPIAGDKVVYYHGALQDAFARGRFGVTTLSVTGGIGDIIRQKQTELEASARFKRSDLMLIVRPMSDASYKTIVDLLDEVLINQVTHYAFVDITDDEVKFLSAHGFLD